jgi:tetratricopeptide (TPR) repeat protein
MSFNEIFESAYSQNLHHDPRKFVDFYDHNRILIEGQNITSNNFIYDRVTRLTSDYAHSLIHNESHTKAKPEIEKAIKLFEEHPDYQEQDLLELKYYETLVFDRAVVNYYAKNHKEAIEDLTKLAKKFPDDEKFKKWLKVAKTYKFSKIEKALYFSGAGSLIMDVFFEGLHPALDLLLTIGLATSLTAIGVIEFIKWKRKKST